MGQPCFDQHVRQGITTVLAALTQQLLQGGNDEGKLAQTLLIFNSYGPRNGYTKRLAGSFVRSLPATNAHGTDLEVLIGYKIVQLLVLNNRMIRDVGLMCGNDDKFWPSLSSESAARPSCDYA